VVQCGLQTCPVSAIRARCSRMWLVSVVGVLAEVEIEHAPVAACRGQSELVGAASRVVRGEGKRAGGDLAVLRGCGLFEVRGERVGLVRHKNTLADQRP
jgi:hypothetical protein